MNSIGNTVMEGNVTMDEKRFDPSMTPPARFDPPIFLAINRFFVTAMPRYYCIRWPLKIPILHYSRAESCGIPRQLRATDGAWGRSSKPHP